MHTSANTKMQAHGHEKKATLYTNKHDDNDACLFYHKSVGREIDLQHDTCSHVYYNFVCAADGTLVPNESPKIADRYLEQRELSKTLPSAHQRNTSTAETAKTKQTAKTITGR